MTHGMKTCSTSHWIFSLLWIRWHRIRLKGLEGMIDAEYAGVMGYSFDGYNALAMSGARVDPEFYLSQCANAVRCSSQHSSELGDKAFIVTRQIIGMNSPLLPVRVNRQ